MSQTDTHERSENQRWAKLAEKITVKLAPPKRTENNKRIIMGNLPSALEELLNEHKTILELTFGLNDQPLLGANFVAIATALRKYNYPSVSNPCSDEDIKRLYNDAIFELTKLLLEPED